MSFRDLDEFLVVEPLVLPIRGKEYSFPGSVSARVWLQLQSMSEQMQLQQDAARRGEDYAPDNELVNDTDEAAMRAEMFGDAEQEMVDDGLSSAHIKAVFFTLIAFHLSGREAAEVVWDAQGGSAAPNRAQRRSQSKKQPPAASRASSSAPRSSRATSSAGTPSSSTGD
jgi:hypothetical protein